MKRIASSIVVLLCLIVPATSAAATFTVNTTADGPVTGTCAPGETCTLRDAIEQANSTVEADVVVVPAGRYVLSEGALETTEDTVIAGAGARGTVVDADGKSRGFYLSSSELTIEGLTITGGAATSPTEALMGDGGGIAVGTGGGKLTLKRVAVVGNTATLNGGGVAAPPEEVNPTEFEGKTVVIEDSTIARNGLKGGALEALGGGVYVLGNLEMLNSTVTGNVVETTGAAQGGGVLVGPALGESGTTVTSVINSTIAGNSVGAGGVGGGLAVYNPAALAGTSSTITNTIIAGNLVGGAAGDCGPMTVTTSHNLSGDASCMFTDAGSKTNTDPKLGALTNNGGETDTLALLAGSPAIDAGTKEGCPATDQRGVARPVGTACDIGAYEFQPTAPPASGGSGGGAPVGTGGAGTTADLSLKIKAKPKKPARGKKLAFVVTVRDGGPATATGVVFKGTVPATALKVKGKGLGKKACKLGKAKKGHRALTCKLGDIAAGKAKSFRVRVTTASAPKKLVVRGRVRSGVTDPTLKNAKAKAVAKLAG